MHLGTQLFVASLLILLVTLMHGFGVVLVTKLLRLEDTHLRAHRLDFRAFGILTSMALSLFLLHALEIALFGFFYLAVGAIDSLEEALYFSASSYATLGHPDIPFPDHWRLLGAIEGLAGFLLIGWSTAVFVTDMNKLLRK
jgi:hypothetical protein